MANGVLGLTRPSAGARDIVGMRAFRLNQARERLIKAGRPTSTLTHGDLEAEAKRHEQEQANGHAADAELARLQAAAERSRRKLEELEAAGPGDIITDLDGTRYRVGEDGESLTEVSAQ